MSLDKRFWRKVDKAGDNECWLWNASTNGKYGLIRSASKPFKHLLAHRVSYELNVGDIPGGMYVMHSCDTPLCVNPKHLSIGTQAENMADCVQKDRQKRSQLNEVDRERIFDMYRSGALMREIAVVFGVSRPSISLILSGQTSRFLTAST